MIPPEKIGGQGYTMETGPRSGGLAAGRKTAAGMYRGTILNLEKEFWLARSLEEMSQEEWEALCDGCGRCTEACIAKIDIRDVLRRAVEVSQQV